jgi:hypothetical protein
MNPYLDPKRNIKAIDTTPSVATTNSNLSSTGSTSSAGRNGDGVSQRLLRPTSLLNHSNVNAIDDALNNDSDNDSK